MAGKRKRLQELVSLGGVSDATLTSILESLSERPVPGGASRFQVERASVDVIKDMVVEVQLPTVSGAPFKWEFLSPQLLLQRALGEGGALADLFERRLTSVRPSPEAPWDLILYYDEITPGNVLRPDNKRKFMSVYMSFKQLGAALFREESWLTISVVRMNQVHDVLGGWSRMLAEIMRHMFCKAESFIDVGVSLALREPTLMFARLGVVIADEAALKMMIDAKGASGLRPCPLCKNVVMKGSGLATHDPTNYLVELTCCDPGRFDRATDRDLFDAMSLLKEARATSTKKHFSELQRSVGFNYNEFGILSDVSLLPLVRPATTLRFDPMHCVLSNGVASVEVHLFLQRCNAELGLRFHHFETFCKASWTFPRNFREKGAAIHQVFNASRERASTETFKASASELLTVLPLLVHFADTCILPSGKLAAEVESLKLVGDMVAILQAGKAGDPDHESLKRVVHQHFQGFMRVYGEEQVKPKHHYTLHLASQLERDNMTLDAFALERKHQSVKRVANNISNTQRYERSVLARVTVDYLRASAVCEFGDGLKGQSGMLVPGLTVAKSLCFCGLHFYEGDIIFQGGAASLVRACCADASGHLSLVVEPFRLVRRLSSKSGLWRRTNQLQHVRCSGINLAACWTFEGTEATVLRL